MKRFEQYKTLIFGLLVLSAALETQAGEVETLVDREFHGTRPITVRCRMVTKYLHRLREIEVPLLTVHLPMDASNNDTALAQLDFGSCEQLEPQLKLFREVQTAGQHRITRRKFFDKAAGSCKHFFNDQVSVKVTNIKLLKDVVFTNHQRFTLSPLPREDCP